MLLHQHHVKDAEGVVNPEDRPVAPGCSKNHQPASKTTFGWDEASSVAGILYLHPRLEVRTRREWWLAPGLDQLRIAVLLHDFTLAAVRLVILSLVWVLRGIPLLHLRTRSRLLRPGLSAGRLRLVV